VITCALTTLMARAQQIENQGIFLGGPLEYFEVAGRKLMMLLLNEGLMPGSKVLDVGCGSLRCGYWLIHFLDQNCYYGIEPDKAMVDAGLNILLEPGQAEIKQPRFDENEQFDFAVFDQQFDYVVARAIWIHASKAQIQTMLDEFVNVSTPSSVFLASYFPATRDEDDYQGATWIGRSRVSNQPASIRHRFDWIKAECARRKLTVEEIAEQVFDFGHHNQIWLRIRHMTAGDLTYPKLLPCG